MRIEECINRVDATKPNQYGTEEKLRWLSVLDASIKSDIIDMYKPLEGEDVGGEFTGYTPDDLAKELLAPFPHDELYVAYLKAKIDEANGEGARYNNSATTFNGLLLDFEKHYNKTHTPKRRGLKIFKGVRI